MAQRAMNGLSAVPEGSARAVSGLIARWGLPVAVFVLVRLLGLAVLAVLAFRDGSALTAELSSWDGQWLLGLARGGYGGVPPGLVDAFGGRSPDTALAFFPGYPAAVAAVAALTGADVLAAGLVVSALSGVVAACGLARLGELVPGGSHRVGLVLVALFAAAPMGVVLSMTYSEGLFCALAAWSLVGVLRRRWLLAGGCAALAGLVRPTAVALVVVVVAAAVVAGAGGWRHHGRRHDGRGEGWRAWAGALLAPVGLLGYLGYVTWRTGSPLGWFAIQRAGWGSAFDGGSSTLRFSLQTLADGRSVLEVVTVAVLAGAVVLLAVCALVREPLGRQPWPLLVYGAIVVVMDLGSDGLMNSKVRLLLPAFTLLLPVALGLSRRRPGTVVAVLTGLALASAWFGAYAVVTWHYAI